MVECIMRIYGFNATVFQALYTVPSPGANAAVGAGARCRRRAPFEEAGGADEMLPCRHLHCWWPLMSFCPTRLESAFLSLVATAAGLVMADAAAHAFVAPPRTERRHTCKQMRAGRHRASASARKRIHSRCETVPLNSIEFAWQSSMYSLLLML